jgi:hypothetical protein
MSDTPPVLSFWRRQLGAFSSLSSEKLDGAISFFKKTADYLVTLLRLFAVLTVTLILTFIVLEVWRSSNLVVVKPFTLPKKMQELSPDGGRIIANQLSHAMKNAENRLYCTIKEGDDNGQRCLPGSSNLQSMISKYDDSFLVGGNIKLPETGISISDVVEFISRMFGRRNIIGSVYEDNGELILQVELDGTVFKTSRLLDCNRLAGSPAGSRVIKGCDPSLQLGDAGRQREGELNFDLINDMLEESSVAMLSTASANHNLFYYCSGQTDVDVHRNDADVNEWFGYCSRLRANPLVAAELGSILHTLEDKQTQARGKQGTESDLTASIRDLVYSTALAKAKITCPGYQKGEDCVLPKMASTAPVVMQATQSAPLPMAPPAPIIRPSVAAAGESTSADNTGGEEPASAPPVDRQATGKLTRLKPASANLEAVTRQWDNCIGASSGIPRPPATGREILDSNIADGDGAQAYRSGLYQQALDSYTRALDINCRNAFAWGNIGDLFTQQRDIEAAVFALERSTSLSPDRDWAQNGLCIARAYALPLERMEEGLVDESCKKAREVNPLNQIVLDKRFYLAVAGRYAEENQYAEALASYQKVLSVDNKLDCNTRDVLDGLKALGEKQGKTEEISKAICDIKAQAVPLPSGKLSQCDADLQGFCVSSP